MKPTSIESDDDFVKKHLDDLDIDYLDSLPDNRKSKFFLMSTQEKLIRLIAFIVIITINYN